MVVPQNIKNRKKKTKQKLKIRKKFKIELPYNPTIPFLGIFPKKTKTVIRKDICISVFIAALFTIAKIWTQPKRPMNQRRCGNNIMKYYSAIKKN